MIILTIIAGDTHFCQIFKLVVVTAQKLRGYFVPRPPAAGGEHDHPLVFEQLLVVLNSSENRS
jgi:hypothetical protein